MKSTCHQCGREYLTARNLAGKPVACRSCGALNDGAGGPPPVQPPKAADATRPRATGGASFTIGGGLPKVDPRALERELKAAEAAEGSVPNARGVSIMNRTVLALGLGAVVLACVMVGALFVVRYIEQNPAGSRDWSGEMLATPQLLGEDGTGSGFLIEHEGRLWIVTNFHVIDGNEEMDVVFPDPETGKEIFRIADQQVAKFRLHRRFLDTLLAQSDGMHYDIAAIDVEAYRRSLADLDILPRDMLPAARVRSGQNAYAVGHPGSDFGFADEADRRSAGTARHTLTSGLVSAVRRADDRPTVVQFDAAANSGNSGGPLFNADGDVIAVVTWRDVERKASGGAEARQGMSFGIATEHPLEILRNGRSYAEFAREAGWWTPLGGSPVDPRQAWVYAAWSTFAALRPAIVRSVRDGWGTESAIAVRVVGVPNQEVVSYTTGGSGASDVYVVVLPEDPRVDVDAVVLDPLTGTVIADDRAIDPGDIAEVIARGVVQQGAIPLAIRTYIDGVEVPARVAIIVYERYSGQIAPPPLQPPTPPSQPAQPPSQPTSPPSQPAAPPAITPPGSAPSSPPTSQPSTPPSQPSPSPSPPTGPITGKARAIDMKSGMAETVYASSLIGLREFDRRYLTNVAEEDAFEAIEAAFVDSTPNFVAGDPAFARDIMRASLLRSFWFPIANGMTLPHSRPLCEVHLEQVPGGSAVGVYLELDPVWRRYLPLPPSGLVSRSGDTRLVPGAASDAVRHDQSNGTYRVPLELPWNDDELRTLAQPVEIPYTLVARYDDASEDRLSGRIRVNPVSQVEHAYPFGISVASIVDETHPWVRRLIDEVNQRPEVRSSGTTITGAGGGPDDRLASLALVWQDLVRRGLRYQSLTAAEGIAQRCRLVHESIASGNANCVDGTVLLASFMEAVGIDSYIVLMPGHAMLCLDVGDQFVFIETTAAGGSVPGDPSTRYNDEFAALRSRGSLFRAAEIDLLEEACEAAARTVGQQIDQAQQVLAQYRAMAGEFERRQGDPAWMASFESVLIALSQQIQIVPVSVARAHGVRPVGAPPNIDQTFRIPPRR